VNDSSRTVPAVPTVNEAIVSGGCHSLQIRVNAHGSRNFPEVVTRHMCNPPRTTDSSHLHWT
jgi:hypothetical protein